MKTVSLILIVILALIEIGNKLSVQTYGMKKQIIHFDTLSRNYFKPKTQMHVRSSERGSNESDTRWEAVSATAMRQSLPKKES